MLLARLQLLAAALFFSTGGMAIKACQLTSWQVASFRCLIAGVALVALIPAARQKIPLRAWWVGLAFAATLVLFALANKATTSANAIFLQAVAPLYLVPLAPLLLREKVQRRDLGIMVLLAGGLALLLLGNDAASATAPAPARGNALAAASGLTWAFTVLGLRWLAKSPAHGNAISAVVAGNLIGFLGTLYFALPMDAPRPNDVLWMLYLGVFQIGLAYWLLTRAVSEVSAFETSLLLLAEPLFNPIWTWLVLSERPSDLAIVGGLVILVATTLKTWLDLRSVPQPIPATSRDHV